MTEGAMHDPGLLVIWSDVAPSDETDYLHWLTREHTSERVGTEGFLGVRVFRALTSEVRRYLIVYDLESTTALDGADYLDKLNSPTPWTQRIMPRLGNFIRGGGRVAARAGIGGGGVVAPVMLPEDASANGGTLVATLAQEDHIVAVRYLETDKKRTMIGTREKTMRGGDRTFAGLLLVEGLDEASVRAVLGRVRAMTPGAAADEGAQLYGKVFSLDRRDLPDV
jgi:hypothetical protein